MPDPTLFLWMMLGALVILVVVQGALSVRAKRKHQRAVLLQNIETARLLVSFSRDAEKRRNREAGRIIDHTLREIVALERATGHAIADAFEALRCNPVDQEFRDMLFGGAPLREAPPEPVEHTASGQVASDGGTTLETEANAPTMAQPIKPARTAPSFDAIKAAAMGSGSADPLADPMRKSG